ncbi:MAG TPA: ricin-type beta-trefoil lectin domain protein [Kofleriaceae bacterium]
MRRTTCLIVLAACSAEISNEEEIVEPPEDPACATDPATPRASNNDELAWDLDRDLDSDRPVCSADEPDCDRIDAPDAEDDGFVVDGMAIDHDPDAIAYGLADPLTSSGKYRVWPNGRIPYTYVRDSAGNPYVNAATRTALSQAMTNWEAKTEGRIKFRPKQSSDTAYVRITQGSPLVRPFVGYRAGQVQTMQLRDSEYVTVVKHELGHVIGLHHEQRRTDRLNYIKVRTANIVNTETCKYQFATCSTCKRVGTYDRISVMHYRTTDLANCRTGPVLLKLDGSAINHYWQVSAKDVTAVKTMYATPPPPPPTEPAPVLPESGSIVATKLCAAVAEASTTDGAALQAATCAKAGNQDWRITSDGQLRVQHSLQCAAVVGCSAAGATLAQRACSPTAPDQKWTFDAMQIVNGMTGECLEAGTEGAVVGFKACSAATTQRFDYRSEVETIEIDGLCVTATDRATAGDDIVLAACDGRDSQRWLQARGSFVSRANTARCMRVEAGPQTGTKLELGDCNDAIEQRWALRGTIRDARAGYCLQGSETAGSALALADCDGSPTQTWTFWSR